MVYSRPRSRSRVFSRKREKTTEKAKGGGEGSQGIVCGVNVLCDSDQSGNRFSDCATYLVFIHLIFMQIKKTEKLNLRYPTIYIAEYSSHTFIDKNSIIIVFLPLSASIKQKTLLSKDNTLYLRVFLLRYLGDCARLSRQIF